jgi:hypothetical protein
MVHLSVRQGNMSLIYSTFHPFFSYSVSSSFSTQYFKMSQYTDSELDALFEDTTFPLLTLPGELRNNFYEAYFTAHVTTIHINELGDIVVPAITCASKQLAEETKGYFTTWFKNAIVNPAVQIVAKIRNFEHKALQSRLCALSEQFAVPKEKLVTRTKVTFLGTMNFADLWAWTAEHLRDPASTPVFEQTESQTAHLSGFSSPSLRRHQLC